MNDFTPDAYKQLLLALQQAGYAFFTFEEWCEGKAQGCYVILRHDIDKSPENALVIAKIEAETGIRSTFFFRTSPTIFIPSIIKEIHALGHEIGYHYRDLVDASGSYEKAIILFQKNLSALRSVVPVVTICMDGCPWSKFDNRDLWKKYDYRDFGIIGEPYFDLLAPLANKAGSFVYLTDTARMWDGDKYNIRDKAAGTNAYHVPVHSTFDLIRWLNTNPPVSSMMITTHPQRWTDNPWQWWQELVLQGLKNVVKGLILRMNITN